MDEKKFEELVQKTIKESIETELKPIREEIAKLKEQQPADERQTFMGACMKDGKSMEECAKEWDQKQQATTEITESLKKYPADVQESVLKVVKEGKLEDAKKLLEAEWDTEYINNLPDSAFATIGTGGEKDADGKTVPRSLRHLPYKNAQGNVDVPHLRNALARMNQIESGSQAEAKNKLCAAAKEVNLESEACGLTQEAYLVEARKEIVDLKAKVADVEKKFQEANDKKTQIISIMESVIPSDQVTFSHGQSGGFKRLVEEVKRAVMEAKQVV